MRLLCYLLNHLLSIVKTSQPHFKCSIPYCHLTKSGSMYFLLFKLLIFFFCALWIQICYIMWYPRVELLDHTVVLFLFFKGNYTVFHGGCWILHSHQQCTRVQFSPHPVFCCLFCNSHSNRYEVISHCGFDLHFPDD